ncbi:LnmK family bifunctional acyltransferase/decarboxylase [Micromonospora sp. NPDC002296]|uniref:LnmK family bifunctional acyltransferase/decarboxylase n=1 Tax=Micromonospora sp. NPDC002296 TaxID=3154271 RepID=UPI00332509C8
MTAAPLAREPVLLDESCLTREVTVTPSMCGGSSLVFAQLGDWTWEAVNAACRTNVYLAQNSEGQPTYLSFYYFHVKGSPTLHPYGLTFGDELEVTSRVLDFGSQSVLTLHRLSRVGSLGGDRLLEPEEFYERPRPDCMYVENLNRWVSRSRANSNQKLVEASPVGFQHEHLPRLPSAYSPRSAAGRAREKGTFYPDGVPGFLPVASAHSDQPLDPVRDLNGVGLVYFASYFSIIDTALLGLWLKIGRSKRQFLRRRVIDHQLGYFGNADLDSVFSISVRLWRDATDQGVEIADIAVRDRGTGRLLAVAAIKQTVEEA